MLIITLKVVFTLTVNVVGELYQNGVKGSLDNMWACYPCMLAVWTAHNTLYLCLACSPHLSSLNILARLWSSCQPVIVCHKTEPSLSPLKRARLQHRALTSKQGLMSRKEVSVANQVLICRDLLSWGDHMKTPVLPASCVHCWGPETRVGKGRPGMSLLFRQVVIIPP